MSRQDVAAVARALLYEGYLLYPYRPSAVKNRQRFNFGVIYPETSAGARDGVDPWLMQTECLVLSGGAAAVEGRRRCRRWDRGSAHARRSGGIQTGG